MDRPGPPASATTGYHVVLIVLNNQALIIIMLVAEMVTQNFVYCFDCDEKEISLLLNTIIQLF